MDSVGRALLRLEADNVASTKMLKVCEEPPPELNH
jgi:hypothetical protein